MVQLWLKSWSRTYLQMWSNFGPEDSKSPFVVHIVVQYDPNYGLIVAQLWSNHGPNYSPLSKQKYNLCIIHISTFFNNLWSNVAGLWSKWKWKYRTIFLTVTFECGHIVFQNEIQMLQIVVKLWLKSWTRINLQMWFNFDSDDSKCPFVAHILVRCGPNYGLNVDQIMVQSWSKLFTSG